MSCSKQCRKQGSVVLCTYGTVTGRADMLIKMYSWRNGVHGVSSKWYKTAKEWGVNCYFMDSHAEIQKSCVKFIYHVYVLHFIVYSSRHSPVSVALLAVLLELEIRFTDGFTLYQFIVMLTVFSCYTYITLKQTLCCNIQCWLYFCCHYPESLSRKLSTVGTSIPITQIISHQNSRSSYSQLQDTRILNKTSTHRTPDIREGNIIKEKLVLLVVDCGNLSFTPCRNARRNVTQQVGVEVMLCIYMLQTMG